MKFMAEKAKNFRSCDLNVLGGAIFCKDFVTHTEMWAGLH